MEQYAQQPAAVEVFPVGNCTDLILRKNITETAVEATETQVAATVWQCEERQLRVPGSYTAEAVSAEFETWWAYDPAAEQAAQAKPTTAERLALTEAAILELGTLVAGLLTANTTGTESENG